jgi:hypothetical protein
MSKNKGKKQAAPAAQETSTALAPIARGPSPAMLALFQPIDQAKLDKLKRRNIPRMVKPDQVPIGATISGRIKQIVNSPTSEVKGKLLWLVNDSGTEFTFPVTGVIRSALAPGIKNDDEKLTEHLEKELGKMFYARRQPDGEDLKHGVQPDGRGKKMFVFDVFTSEE